MTVKASSGLQSRLEAAETLLRQEGIDMLLVSPSADLQYLTGYGGHASERPTLLVVQPGKETVMLIPQLEAPRIAGLEGVKALPYAETESPFALLAKTVGPAAAGTRFALSDQTWAVVLLRLQQTFAAQFESATPLQRELRMRKGPEEIELLARAGAMADAAFGEIIKERFAGRSERQLGDLLNEKLRGQGLSVGAWGPIVGSGPNSASPHHMTGDRVIQSGDAVVLDFGGTLEGYQADITRTVHVDPAPDEFRRVYEVVRVAQEKGVQAAKPGAPAQSVDRATRSVIEDAGYGQYFVHRTGHGIGLEGHEEPFMIEGNQLLLEPGMTFSVEPGIYLPGRFGIRIEDIVAITEDGARRLNQAPRDLKIVA
ncbi:MAG: aminopeptidase P family protein [Chloroflexota bacterium]|nr:aminopeptidase P family protein [Chloroflexota bacterium]